MKKVILSLAVVLSASLVSGQELTKEQIKAQKKERKALMTKVKEAEKAITIEDYNGALNTVMPATQNPLTNTDAYVWYVACKAKKGIIDAENFKRSQAQAFNADLMYNSAYDIFDYLIKCDEYDKAPDAKGKVAPKYSKEIVQMMYENRNQLYNGGAFYYGEEKYDNAFKMFDMFINASTLAPLDTIEAVKNPELNATAAFNAVLCGMQTENYQNVLKHIDLAIEDANYKKNCLKYKATAQGELGDSAAWLQTLKTGVASFPDEPYFYQNMILYYQTKNQPDEMTKFADNMISSNPENPLFYYVKGMVLQEGKKIEEAVEWYNKALEKDPNYDGALFNLGICYTALAQEYSQKNASTNIRDKAKIKKDQEVLDGYFKKALPLYEKLRELQPDKPERWGMGLSNCYYNLKMDAKLKEVEQVLEKLNNAE